MILTIWRHGQAGEAASDEHRMLTARGREEVARGGLLFLRQCQARGIALPERILFSRWRRTTETADILSNSFGLRSCLPCEALIPGAGIGGVDRTLEQQPALEHLVLVSHQPLVSSLVDHYLGDAGRVPGLSPGGLACLRLEDIGAGCASLNWWAFPPQFLADQ